MSYDYHPPRGWDFDEIVAATRKFLDADSGNRDTRAYVLTHLEDIADASATEYEFLEDNHTVEVPQFIKDQNLSLRDTDLAVGRWLRDQYVDAILEAL